MPKLAAPSRASRLYLWPGRSLYLGPLQDTAVHAHHALQVCVALRGSFRLRASEDAAWRRYSAAAIASDAPHQLHGGASILALVYLDPEEAAARRLGAANGDGGIRRIPPRTVVDLAQRFAAVHEAGGGANAAADIVAALIARLTTGAPPDTPMDDRVRRAVAHLQAAPNRRASAGEVAAAVGLSASRLGHLFSAHVGLPLRRYLLWLRLQDAVREIAGGASLTDAAHGAGFADSAHLSRTFRRMFGIVPSDLARGSRFVQA